MTSPPPAPATRGSTAGAEASSDRARSVANLAGGITPDGTASPAATLELPSGTRASVFLRLLAIQGSWNYETMLGNGVAFAMEPALRRLDGGRDGAAYRAAMARNCRFFNAHPYMAAMAVGALIRAELAGDEPARIERFRTALCGPLGSCGDRLIWASWLPLCSLLALAAWGLGGGPLLVVGGFLLLYNLGHLGLRAWGLHVGLREGLKVAACLGSPPLRRGPELLGRGGAFLAGLVLPLAVLRSVGTSHLGIAVAVLGAGALVGGLLVRVQGRWEGWRVAIPILVLLVLFSVTV